MRQLIENDDDDDDDILMTHTSKKKKQCEYIMRRCHDEVESKRGVRREGGC